MSLHDCRECLKLWQAYLDSATEYADLKLEQESAVRTGNVSAFERLEREIDLARETRRRARQNIKDHTAWRHPNEAAA